MRWRMRLDALAIIVVTILTGILSGYLIRNIFLRLLFQILLGFVLGVLFAKRITHSTWGEIFEIWHIRKRK